MIKPEYSSLKNSPKDKKEKNLFWKRKYQRLSVKSIILIVLALAAISMLYLYCKPIWIASNVKKEFYERYNADEKFLVMEPIGAFGNRMGAVAGAYAVSKYLNRTFVLYWDYQSYNMPALYEDLFVSPTFPTLADHPILSFIKNVRSSNIDYYEGLYSRYIALQHIKDCWSEKEKLLSDMSSVIHVKDFTEIMFDEIPLDIYAEYYVEFYSQLKPTRDIEKIINDFWLKHFKGKKVIGIHYRTFTIEDSNTPKLPKGDIKNYIAEMDKALEDEPDAYFYFATDNMEFVDIFSKQYKNKIIRYEYAKLSRATLQATKESLIDWFLLQKTEFIIGTYQSTFSNEAAVMTKQHKKIDIGPVICAFCDPNYFIYHYGGVWRNYTDMSKHVQLSCSENGYHNNI